MTKRYFIGISSGVSLLGVDAALVRADGFGADMGLSLKHFLHMPFGNELRELLWRISTTATPEVKHLATLHRILGETYALAVKQLLEQSKFPVQEVLCIGCSRLPLWDAADAPF